MLKPKTARGSSSGTSMVRYVDVPAYIKPHNVCIQNLDGKQVQLTAGIEIQCLSIPIKKIVATAFVNAEFINTAKSVILNEDDSIVKGYATLTTAGNLVIAEMTFSRTDEREDPKIVFEYGTMFNDMNDVTLTTTVRDFVNISSTLYAHHIQEI